MKILSTQFWDQTLEWKQERVLFKDMTLLVGASGVGKTRMLKSIQALRNIVNGQAISGYSWDIHFRINDSPYQWKGRFEDKGIYAALFSDDEDEENERNSPIILHEFLYCDGVEIIRRNENAIYFVEKETVKLPLNKSVLYLLKEEPLVAPVYNSFQKIILSNRSDFSLRSEILTGWERIIKKYITLKEIRNADISTYEKLLVLYKNQPHIFEKIKTAFIDVFPHVEEVEFRPLHSEGENESNNIPIFLKEFPFLQIKEKGVNRWIEQARISSGMLKTILHLSEMYVCADGSVILIDEFENSLGVNCIDAVTSQLLQTKRDLQFILTSHHPYIINNISYENWKIVTRKAGAVRANDATDFNLGKSRHEAFTQLMNLEEYQTGVEFE